MEGAQRVTAPQRKSAGGALLLKPVDYLAVDIKSRPELPHFFQKRCILLIQLLDDTNQSLGRRFRRDLP
jgi:hypothetical protein